jgi:hypothetical protein
MGYRLDDREIGVRVTARVVILSWSQLPDRRWDLSRHLGLATHLHLVPKLRMEQLCTVVQHSHFFMHWPVTEILYLSILLHFYNIHTKLNLFYSSVYNATTLFIRSYTFTTTCFGLNRRSSGISLFAKTVTCIYYSSCIFSNCIVSHLCYGYVTYETKEKIRIKTVKF